MNPKQPAKPSPCPTCICRVANHDRETDRGPGWDIAYNSDLQRQVWEGSHEPSDPTYAMRNGGLNYCHQGHSYACAGTQVVQERELLRFHERAQQVGVDEALEHSTLSRLGIERIAARMGVRWPSASHIASWSRQALLSVTHPALDDPAIGHPAVEPPKPGEFPPADVERKRRHSEMEWTPDMWAGPSRTDRKQSERKKRAQRRVRLPDSITATDAVTLRLVRRQAGSARYDICEDRRRLGHITIRLAEREVLLRAWVHPYSRDRGTGTLVMRALLGAIRQDARRIIIFKTSECTPRSEAWGRACGFVETDEDPESTVFAGLNPYAVAVAEYRG